MLTPMLLRRVVIRTPATLTNTTSAMNATVSHTWLRAVTSMPTSSPK